MQTIDMICSTLSVGCFSLFLVLVFVGALGKCELNLILPMYFLSFLGFIIDIDWSPYFDDPVWFLMYFVAFFGMYCSLVY